VQLLEASPPEPILDPVYLNVHLPPWTQTQGDVLVEASSTVPSRYVPAPIKGREVDFCRTMAKNGVILGGRERFKF
jgi:hypothetical protein